MADNEKSSGFDSIKSLLLSGATLGPIAIGLGLGIKNGLGTVTSNKAIDKVMTGGQPSQLEMIGRAVGISRRGMIKKSLETARNLGKNSLKAGSSHSSQFAAMAASPGPQRNAILNAYLGMLNSSRLNLTQTEIANEAEDLIARKGSNDFQTEIMSRIEKRATEMGVEQQEGFLSELQNKAKQILRLEEDLSKVGNGVTYVPETANRSTHSIIREEDIGKRLTKTEADRFARLQQIIADATGYTGKYKIAEVNTGGGRGVFVSGRIDGVHFDVPLSLVRGKFQQGAIGGVMVLNNTGTFSTQTVIGGAFNYQNRSLVAGEDWVLDELENLMKLHGQKGMSEMDLQELLRQHKARTYDKGQFLNRASDLEIANASKKAYQVQVKGTEAVINNILLDPVTKMLVSEIGITPGGLAGEHGTRYLYQADSPFIGGLYTGYHQPGDFELTSRIQQYDKEYNIIKSNDPVNKINLVNQLDWSNNSNVSFRQFAAGDSRRALAEVLSRGRASSLSFYQLDPDAVGGFRQATGLYEGTSLTGKTYSHEAKTKTARVMGMSREGKQAGLLSEIFDIWQKKKGTELRLSHRQLKKLAKKHGQRDFTLGYSPEGNVVKLDLRKSNHSGVVIRNISPINGPVQLVSPDGTTERLARKTNFGEAEYQISFAPIAKRSRRMKIHGTGAKGMVVKARSPKSLRSGIAHTVGEAEAARYEATLARQNPHLVKGLGALAGTSVTEAKHLLRSQASVNQQMLTGAMVNLNERLGQSELHAVFSQASQLGGDDLAKFLNEKLRASGFKESEIAPIIGSQYHFYKGKSDTAAMERLLAELDAPAGSNVLSENIKNVKGFVGIESFAVGATNSGIGREAKLERRSFHGIIRHMQSLGANEGQIVSMLSDLTARGLASPDWEAALTNATLGAATKNNAATLNQFASDMGIDLKVTNTTASKLGIDVRGNKAFTESSLINLAMESDQAKAAARNVFQSENILLPGNAGLPAFGDLRIKRDGSIIDFPTEYERSLQEMLTSINNPHASEDEITRAMGRYKANLAKGWETSFEGLVAGKVAGSAQGIAQAVDTESFGENRRGKLMATARADKMTSIFSSDVVFFRALSGLKEGSQIDDELYEMGQQFLFRSNKSEGGVYGMVTRHPTLGEGHVPFRLIRRAGTQEDMVSLFNLPGMKSHLSQISGQRATIETLAAHLAGGFAGKGGSNQRQTIALILKSVSNFMGTAEGAVYLPTITGEIEIDGVKTSHLFSSFTQMVGDTDGDTLNLILLRGKENKRFFRGALSDGKMAENFVQSEMEWSGLQSRIKEAKKASDLLRGDEELGSDMMRLQKTLREIRGKNVGAYSKAIDRIKVGMLAYGRDDNLTRQGVAALTILEELLIKASKREGAAANIANEFAQRVRGNDIDGAIDIIRKHAFGGDTRNIVVTGDDLLGFMGNRRAEINLEALFEHMRSSFEEMNLSGSQIEQVKGVRNFLERQSYDQRVMVTMGLLEEGHGGFISGVANAMLTGEAEALRPKGAEAIAATVERGARSASKHLLNRKAILPIAIGAGASLLALSLSGPGYENKPLEMKDPSLAEASNRSMQQGSMLSGFTNHITGQQGATDPQYAYPDVSRNSLIQNGTYVKDEGGARMEVTGQGLESIPQMSRIVSNLGSRNNFMIIQDNRKPISGNFIDSIRED